jgi:PLP dependent protein
LIDSVSDRLIAVEKRIAAAAERAGRNPLDVTLVTVTKNWPIPSVIEAVEAGARALGENRAREAAEKFAALGRKVNGRPVTWHFIGYLQTNKVKTIIELADLIHSVDRLDLAQEIDKRARAAGKIQPVLIEVNIGGEESKAGVRPAAVSGLARAVVGLPNLQLRGLMTMAPVVEDPEETRPLFAELREIQDELAATVEPGCRELSMGMTDDFEIAVEEGATIVRVGRAIMGARPLP